MQLLREHPLVKRTLNNPRYEGLVSAVPSLTINIFYVLYNGGVGLRSGSAWFITMGIYYLLLSVMRFCLIYQAFRNKGEAGNAHRMTKAAGVFLLFLTATLGGSLYLTIQQEIAKSYHTIVMITIATYTFYKLILAVVNAAKARRRKSVLLIALRNIGCADALVSLLSLQTSMMASFGGEALAERRMMTTVTGLAVCVLIMGMGISMIAAPGKEMKKWQNQN